MLGIDDGKNFDINLPIDMDNRVPCYSCYDNIRSIQINNRNGELKYER